MEIKKLCPIQVFKISCDIFCDTSNLLFASLGSASHGAGSFMVVSKIFPESSTSEPFILLYEVGIVPSHMHQLCPNFMKLHLLVCCLVT